MNRRKGISRRRFIKTAGAVTAGVVGFPYVVRSSALGKAGTVAPSNKITMGCIGVGWQGGENLRSFLSLDDVQVVALCDIDKNHLEDAVRIVSRKYGNTDCATYHNFEELIARQDIDSVSIGLPDHWHAIPAIATAKAGKDIFGEKPLSHSLTEGRAMCDAVKRYGIIWQTGSWQRSQGHFRHACEIVRNGRIGKLHTVEVGLPSGHDDFEETGGQEEPRPAPKELDYDRWLGPAPWAPYCPARVHKNWRWHLDYGGGQLMDWVGHHVDIAHWGMGTEYTGPYEIEGYGDWPKSGLWNTATRYRLTAKYANDITMIIAGGHEDIRSGTKWIGTDGWVWVDRDGQLEASNPDMIKEKFGVGDIYLYQSPGHWRNFIDCVKSRATTITPCEVAHRSATPGHLGQIALLLDRKIRFNPDTEEIVGDSTASRMLSNAMRSPWHI
jgi:predicted dehydrogenase